jgi:hypothetical protein
VTLVVAIFLLQVGLDVYKRLERSEQESANNSIPGYR